MKISEVSESIIKAHCGASEGDSDELLRIYADAAKKFITDYTGLTAEQADECPDLTVVYLDIINEMFNQRMIMTSGTQLNEFQRQILAMHSVNLL